MAKKFPDLAIEDPGALEDMKRFIEMIEIFQKKPELFREMRAMVEGKA